MRRTSSAIVDQFAAAVEDEFPGAMRDEKVESVVLACAVGFERYLELRLRHLSAADAADADRALTRAPKFVPPLRLPNAEKTIASTTPRELGELTATLLEHLYTIVDVTLARAARIPDTAPGQTPNTERS